jgi:hypothetical protein
MKLIFCTECHDLFRMLTHERTCECGKSGGTYLEDGLHVEYWGPAVPLGFDNMSFARAVQNQPETGWGERFEAFVIEKQCPTMVKVIRKSSEVS